MKLVTFLKRQPDMSRDAFIERWLTKHAPMAAIFPGLRRYTLSGAIGPDGDADAFAELWFDSRQACQAAYSSDVGRSGSGDANAYTTRRNQALLDENWLTSPRDAAGNKVIIAAKRPDSAGRQRFVDRWLEVATKGAKPIIGSRQARLCFDNDGLILNSNPQSNDGLKPGEGESDCLLEVWAEDDESVAALAETLAPLAAALGEHSGRIEILMLREHRIV